MINLQEISPPKKVSGVSSFLISFPYSEPVVNAVKTIPMHIYHKKEKIWEIPACYLSLALDTLTFIDDISLQLIDVPEIQKISKTDLTQEEINSFKYPPFKHQIEAVNFGLARLMGNGFLLLDSMGLGKEEPVSSLIPTPTGYKRMGDIIPGDQIFGADGKPYDVLKVFPHKDKHIYRVSFTDGTSVNCGLDHLWIARDTRKKNSDWITLSTAVLMQLKPQDWEIPVAEPVQFSKKDFVIHPYILGWLLSKGNLVGAPVSISIESRESLKLIKKYLISDYSLHEIPMHSYTIINKDWTKKNAYREEIKRLNLNITESYAFIPEEYKFGSVDQRLDLLRGLFDATGEISGFRSRITYQTNSEKLVDDISEIVYSLGGSVKVKRKKENFKIEIILRFNPFYLSEKSKYFIERCSTRRIKSIEHSHKEDAQCLMVNSPDQSYLTGKRYTVTHNTYSIMCLAEALHKRGLIDHCLIICGVASLRQNWKKECLKFSNETAMVLGEKVAKSGRIYYKSMKERVEILKNPIDEFFVITNIESLQNEEIVNAINKSGKFGMIAFDEAHRGTRGSQMGTNLLKIKADYKVAATGTVIVNNPQSAFIPLVWTGNDKSTFTNFKSVYCEYGGFNNYQVIGYKNLDLLKDELDSCSLRRTLDQVRDDMPAKTIEPEFIELDESHRKFYDAIKAGVVEEADKVHLDASNLLALTTRLRQATSCPGFLDTNPPESTKVKRCIELVEDIIDSGEKVVILATFKESVNELAAKLAKFHPLINTGDVPDDLVSRNIDEFQNNPDAKLFIGTWAKCSTGITLNAASYMICLDTPYTDAMFQQGCDRIYRVTNTRPAFIKVLLCADTVDERVWQIVEIKKDLGDYLVDSKENNFASESFTNELRSILADLY